jgi:hypothetical protein
LENHRVEQAFMPFVPIQILIIHRVEQAFVPAVSSIKDSLRTPWSLP